MVHFEIQHLSIAYRITIYSEQFSYSLMVSSLSCLSLQKSIKKVIIHLNSPDILCQSFILDVENDFDDFLKLFTHFGLKIE